MAKLQRSSFSSPLNRILTHIFKCVYMWVYVCGVGVEFNRRLLTLLICLNIWLYKIFWVFILKVCIHHYADSSIFTVTFDIKSLTVKCQLSCKILHLRWHVVSNSAENHTNASNVALHDRIHDIY